MSYILKQLYNKIPYYDPYKALIEEPKFNAFRKLRSIRKYYNSE